MKIVKSNIQIVGGAGFLFFTLTFLLFFLAAGPGSFSFLSEFCEEVCRNFENAIAFPGDQY
jgi:hypothetical protein